MELVHQFAHEWACHLCLSGGTGWGWDKGRTAGWQAEGFVKSGLVAVTEHLVGDKEQPKHQWCPDINPLCLTLCSIMPYMFCCFSTGEKCKTKSWHPFTLIIQTYNLVIHYPFSHSTTADLKRHVWSTNYTFMTETLGRPWGALCLMLAPCCLDKAGWLEPDYGDKTRPTHWTSTAGVTRRTV